VNVVVVDLGLGNLGSVLQALGRAGGDAKLSDDPITIARAPRVVLPGVAAFGLGMERAARFKPALQEALQRGAPVLGICLGMQILFEEGEENGARPGLGFLPGRVKRIPTTHLPHIGWQRLAFIARSALEPSGWGYFAHSYYCDAPDDILRAGVDHEGVAIPAAVERGTLFGVQYHPEKSARDGEALLRRFLALPEGL
jgi:glutamine amidotransferase